MAANEVYMNVPAVRDMSKKLSDISDVLNTVAKTLEMISNALKASFFLGLVGAAAVALIDQVKPQIQTLSDQCSSLSKAVSSSVDAFERGDMEGSNLFMTSR